MFAPLSKFKGVSKRVVVRNLLTVNFTQGIGETVINKLVLLI